MWERPMRWLDHDPVAFALLLIALGFLELLVWSI